MKVELFERIFDQSLKMTMKSPVVGKIVLSRQKGLQENVSNNKGCELKKD